MNKYDTVSDGGDNVKHTLALNNTQLNNTTNPLTPLSNKQRLQKPISSTENTGKQDPLRDPGGVATVCVFLARVLLAL